MGRGKIYNYDYNYYNDASTNNCEFHYIIVI